MAKILYQPWINEQQDAVTRAVKNNRIYELTTGEALAAKWLVRHLANKNISFRVINMGAGVKKITTDVSTCPKCGGTGKC